MLKALYFALLFASSALFAFAAPILCVDHRHEMSMMALLTPHDRRSPHAAPHFGGTDTHSLSARGTGVSADSVRASVRRKVNNAGKALKKTLNTLSSGTRRGRPVDELTRETEKKPMLEGQHSRSESPLPEQAPRLTYADFQARFDRSTQLGVKLYMLQHRDEFLTDKKKLLDEETWFKKLMSVGEEIENRTLDLKLGPARR